MIGPIIAGKFQTLFRQPVLNIYYKCSDNVGNIFVMMYVAGNMVNAFLDYHGHLTM